MTKRILAFSGSSSSTSINQMLAGHAVRLIEAHETTLIDIRNYPLPLYSIDIERGEGFPDNAATLKELFGQHDGFVIACPEHNGSMPAIFKNMIDWLSGMEGSIFGDKPVLLISTSPGKGGGATNLDTLAKLVPWWGGKVVGTLSFPGFEEIFDRDEEAVSDKALAGDLDRLIREFEQAVSGGH